ncbi:cytochrome P450 [Micromonospora mirobrigensis]|uniref:Cytochrome P450 n=1 Tax=Micromonospora mirobrigensis TaxID=262898 RepID=A0A1C4YW51_9ACTN|nr:cytochrome P450 [Micromonospora mirobrigensis]SCF24999.1 Cytochrome P450 [Micromonospora mirobrigensis]
MTAPELADPTTVDVADPVLHRDGVLDPVWRWMRGNDPVRWTVRANRDAYWSVTTHADAVRVLRDSRTFSSERGIRLGGDPLAAAAASRKMLIVTDPPRHGEIRRIIGSAFTARTVQRLEQNMRATVTACLDEAFDRGACDIVRIAARLPVSVICDLLGVPREDWDFMLDRTTVAFGAVDEHGGPTAAAAEAHTDILLYYLELVKQRRRSPGEDVVTALVRGEVDGRPLTDEEILLNCDGLISGGNETTRHASVGGLLALAAHPDQWRRLRDDPAVLPTAVEEILRWTTPGAHTLRTAVRDTELAGRGIEAGQSVVVWGGSVNRDETVFDAPDVFRLDRKPNRHLTFGHGAHYCLGGALATSELRVLFGEVARRVASIEVPGPVTRVRSNHIAGFEEAVVALRPAPTADGGRHG